MKQNYRVFYKTSQSTNDIIVEAVSKKAAMKLVKERMVHAEVVRAELFEK